MYFSRVAAAIGTGIIVPIYFASPGTNCVSWQPIIDSITAHPDMQFVSIISPNSGPNGLPGSQPPVDYQACISKLRGSTGINKVIGYVSTAYGNQTKRSVEAINNDTDTYAGWNKEYRPDGIFFDETETTSELLADYTAYAKRVRDVEWASSSFVVLNAGTVVKDNGFYGIADSITTFESPLANIPSTFFNNTSPDAPFGKQNIIAYEAPSVNDSLVQDNLKAAAKAGLGQVYFTDLSGPDKNANPYERLPAEWSAFVDAVASANGSV